MIYDYPYHRNYFNKYNTYYKNNYLNNNLNNYNNKKNDLIKNNYLNNNKENITNEYCQENTMDNLEENQKELQEFRSSSDDTIINLFGIKLAFDDLIILGLLYLLYTEDVKDISLYIVLILLLLN